MYIQSARNAHFMCLFASVNVMVMDKKMMEMHNDKPVMSDQPCTHLLDRIVIDELDNKL